jgi:hypothetical protein
MFTFYINPLSVNEQCYSENDVLKLLNELVDCFKYLLPVITKNRRVLLYDSSIENRQFIKDKCLISSINKTDPDTKKLWFLYTKNRAAEVISTRSQTTITSVGCSEQITGSITNDEDIKHAKWLSFGGNPLSCMTRYNVSQFNSTDFNVDNASTLDLLKNLLPLYEASSKHRKNAYFDTERKEWVAPMALNPQEAQSLLLMSLMENGDRWVFDEKKKKFYRFKLTHNDKAIYHGFEVNESEISQDLLKKLR